MVLSRATTRVTDPAPDAHSTERSEFEEPFLSGDAAVVVPRAQASSARRFVVWFGVVLVMFGVANLAFGHRTSIARDGLSYDFELNWVAAQRLVDRDPLYDRAASRAEAIKIVAPWMSHSNSDPFSRVPRS
jgi:hypothetical protein